MYLSATSIIGDKVKNRSEEDLGKIEDLMVNTDNAEVSYAVVSFGGFLGMGEKLFAVPLESMSVDTEEKCMVLDVDKERLKSAPGFDKDNWPSHADVSFFNSVKKFYSPSELV